MLRWYFVDDVGGSVFVEDTLVETPQTYISIYERVVQRFWFSLEEVLVKLYQLGELCIPPLVEQPATVDVFAHRAVLYLHRSFVENDIAAHTLDLQHVHIELDVVRH